MKKIKKWLKRYLPAEIIGTIFALVASLGVYSLTKNDVLAAIAGAWSETIGFFGTMIIREVRHSQKEHREENKNYSIFSFIKDARSIIFEFGFSEILDTWLIRPFTMYIFPLIIPNRPIGVLVGKLAADIIYYAPAIVSYELQQMHKNRKRS